MSERRDDQTRRQRPADNPRNPADIPRRGYDKRRIPTDTQPLSPSDTQLSSQTHELPPPIYTSPSERPGAPKPPIRAGKRTPRDSGLYLPWWSLLILVLVVGGAAFGLLFFVMSLGSALLEEQQPQIIIVTATATRQALAPAAEQPSVEQPAAQQTGAPEQPLGAPPPEEEATPIATLGPSQTPLPQGCFVNAELVVVNTQGVGLSLRQTPSTTAERMGIARDGERLIVLDGPQRTDGIDWCLVRMRSQSTVQGWASLAFLIPADELDQ